MATMKILKKETKQFQVSEGPQTKELLKRLSKLDNDEREVLLSESATILSNCIQPGVGNSTTGIAIGFVQSGKTMSFTTLTALAVDNGFRVIIYFAGNKNNLLEQTTKRLRQDLLTEGENSGVYKVYQSPKYNLDAHSKITRNLKLDTKPAILITVIKRWDSIDELTKIFKSPELKDAIGTQGVLIIDDEADQASLNNYARKNSKSEDWEEDDFSSTYASILSLKGELSNHSYIQYTATPQGPLLINLMDLLSPKFHIVLTPGKAYTGGKTFFEDNPNLVISIPDKEVYHHKTQQLAECPQSVVNALQVFLMGTAICVKINKTERFLSMMIHADSQTDASKKFYGWVKSLIDNWSNILEMPEGDPSRDELLAEFKDNFDETISRLTTAPRFDDVMKQVLQVIYDINPELVIQGSKEINWYGSAAHILIGADMLNRGFTVEGLSVTYMPRSSAGKSNADTIQQRCRFFGYKQKYLDFCRVYLPNDSIEEYVEYVKHEEILRGALTKGSLDEYEQVMVLSPSMNPTRNNILSADIVKNKLKGWRQMNALQNIDENLKYVAKFLKTQKFKVFEDFGTPDRNHRFCKLSISDAIEFLRDFKVANVPDSLRKSSTIQYLRYLEDKRGIKHAYVFEMAFANSDGRSRTLETEMGKFKINQIFSGPSSSGSSGRYPGDTGIKFEDSICIQIHKIKLKHKSMTWDKKVLYTLGMYYPGEFAHAFVGVAK